jgi:toxin ParE1/3/4
MTRVRISAAAAIDLDEIWLHIASDSPANADRFLDRLVTTITDTLAAAPLAGRARDEFKVGLRSFPFERYLIFYRVPKDDVEIIRIIHGARDLGAIFGD